MQSQFMFFNYVFICATVLCAVENGAVHAAIGETKDELIERFGPPDAVLDKSMVPPAETVFAWVNQPDYKEVFVYMLNGRSALESFSLRRDATGQEDKALTTLLEASARGEDWKPITGARLAGLNIVQKELSKLQNDVPGFEYFWRQTKTENEAFLSSEKPLRKFFIKSKEWAKAMDAKNKN